MKAITIWQPWAEFIAAGVKHNEKLGHKIQRTDCDPCSSQANTPSRTASVRKSLRAHG